MKYLITALILLSCLAAQDVLVSKSGLEYHGTWIKTTDQHIYFKEAGQEVASGVPRSQVESVTLANGTVVFFNSDSAPTTSPAVAAEPAPAGIAVASEPAQVPYSSPPQRKDLEQRQVEALEKIATAQTFFMYYSIAIIALGLISYLAAT